MSPDFYLRPTLQVTRELLGKTLCRRLGDRVERLPLTELEAYDGPDDRA
jgi:3-methyladenine DNA glycosylase Mpg